MFRSARFVTAALAASLVSLAAVAPAAQAAADKTTLVDNIDDVTITKDGIVGVDVTSDGAQTQYNVCSLKETKNSITPSTCEGWLSLLLAAHLSGKKMRIEYGDAEAGPNVPVTWVKVYKN